MIFLLPHSRSEFKVNADEQLGKEEFFLKKLTSGKQKSAKMEIIDWHGSILDCFKNNKPLKGCIKLRTDGIVVYVETSKDKFGWVVPYYKLQLFKSNGLHVYAEGSKISFRVNKKSQKCKNFVTKLLLAKLDHVSSRELMGNYDT
ncbi:MAG: hypothetical protein NWS37_04685 [Flavobacteriaceae bacterium]|nr:hypothetical protein [Flavobacteriaceae bacterium]